MYLYNFASWPLWLYAKLFAVACLLMARILFCSFVFFKTYCLVFYKQGIFSSLAAVCLSPCKSLNSIRFLQRHWDVQHFLVLFSHACCGTLQIFWSLFVKWSSAKFGKGVSRPDWSERELDKTAISKNDFTVLLMFFFYCVYYFNSVFVLCFTVYFSVQLLRGQEILLKSICFHLFPLLFLPQLALFLYTLAAH